MQVRFLCPACHQLLATGLRKVGAQVNCPKCGATILVPNPEETAPAESTAPPAASVSAPASDYPAGDIPAETAARDNGPGNFTTSTDVPPDAVGSDVLGDLSAYGRPHGGSSPSHAAKKRPAAAIPPDDETRIVISRRVLYFQAALLAIVGLLALVAGYLIGAGSRLHGP